MTVHDPVLLRSEQIPTHVVAAERLGRPLAWLAVMTILAAGSIFVLRRVKPSWLAVPGLAGLASASLVLAAVGLVACLGMVLARKRDMTAGNGRVSQRRTPGWPQTTVILLFAAAAAVAVLSDWPLSPSVVNQPLGGFNTASALLLLATPWLLADRYLATVPPERLPEIDDLRALLFLPVFFLAAEAILQVIGAIGFGVSLWARASLDLVLPLICAELSLRTLGTWFLPPRETHQAKATITSILARMLHGRSLSPANPGGVVRSQFGMDFSRSWALRFIRSAALPVTVLMLVFCWFLTGVTRIDFNERGAYERFGKVATILQPGMHVVLPLPFGNVRHVAFGVMRSALIGGRGEGAAPDVADGSSAEGDAPATANRLWDSEQPTDVSYVIASSGQNQQSFQTVSASVRVLYRIGLTDGDARAALYRSADPDALVRALSCRLLAQFFASHTLPVVLGENQGVIARDLRDQLQQALDGLRSGIDVVAVTIEAIHPPSGAASAYRNVQAAEIAATTEIATEQGRAKTTMSVAQLNAHNATDDASATAAETISAAQIDLTDIAADDRPYRAAGQLFLLERYFSDAQKALANVPLEIVDHRLNGTGLPTIDLRPPGMVRDATGQGDEKP
jgi:regulator of protease activity HflC (stomatin/prohibitin superfamily)